MTITSLLLFSAAALSSFQAVEVVRVHDGDTMIISLPDEKEVFGRNISVRIKAIDTAEMSDKRICGRKDAQAAKDALTELLKAGPVDLNHCARDKYFRLLCNVLVDDKYDAATYMIERQLARPYFGEKKKKWKCSYSS